MQVILLSLPVLIMADIGLYVDSEESEQVPLICADQSVRELSQRYLCLYFQWSTFLLCLGSGVEDATFITYQLLLQGVNCCFTSIQQEQKRSPRSF